MPTFINRAPVPRANRIPLIATTAVQTLCRTANKRADEEIATLLVVNLSLGELLNTDSCKFPACDSFADGVIETESIIGMNVLCLNKTGARPTHPVWKFPPELRVSSLRASYPGNESRARSQSISLPYSRLCNFAHIQHSITTVRSLAGPQRLILWYIPEYADKCPVT